MAVTEPRPAEIGGGAWIKPLDTGWRMLVARSALLIALYMLVAAWGFAFTPETLGVPLVWPATGVGLAFVYLYGQRMLPAVGVAALMVTWFLKQDMMGPVGEVVTIAATLASVGLGAAVLRWTGFSPRLERLRDVGLLLFVGGTVSSGLNAIVGAYSVSVTAAGAAFSDLWWVCWLADLIGLMLIAPVLLAWLGGPVVRPAEHSIVKGVLLIVGNITVAAVVYSGVLPTDAAMPLSYAMFPLVMLAALFCPVQITATLVLISSAIALSGTGLGLGPFAAVGIGESLLALNAQLALMVLTALILSAARAERQNAEARARQHLHELAHASRVSSMGEMAGGLAHELNQPLCAVSSYVQAGLRMMDRGQDREALREPLEAARASADRAAGIISGMRRFVSRAAPATEPVDLNAAITEVMTLIRPDARRRQVILHEELSDGLPRVEGNVIELQQVIFNLVRNAMDAVAGVDDGRAPSGRWVRVTTQPGVMGSWVELVVADSGPGFGDPHDPTVFEPFMTSKEGGMGLGLSISRSIVHAHGGDLRIGNGSDVGAQVVVRLPAMVDHGAV